jgi:hypothetical protein
MDEARIDDAVRLHPIEVAFLNGGPDLAILTACVSICERGVVRRDGVGHDLVVEGADTVIGHPLERTAAALLGGGISGATFWIRMRARPEIDDVRRHLIDDGLFRDRSGLGALSRKPRTRAGDRALEQAQAAGWKGAGLVATLGPSLALTIDPDLAEPLTMFRTHERPASNHETSASVVNRGVKRKMWRRRLGQSRPAYGEGIGGMSGCVYGASCGHGSGHGCGGGHSCGGSHSCGGHSCGGGHGCGGGCGSQ